MSENVNLSEYHEIKIKRNEEMNKIETLYEFPKYTTQIINLANQNSKGTQPKNVGQLSDLIQEIPENSFKAWKKFYLEENDGSDKIESATDIAYDGVLKLKDAIDLIDREMVRNWVEDLVLVKTAYGLLVQETILKYLSEIENTSYRLATAEEESKNIDGFIGDLPVQIKNKSYTSKNMIPIDIDVETIYYGVTEKYINIYRK